MRKILIVNDDTTFRKMLKSILLSKFPSMAVKEASEGTEAWKKISTTCPDLIFVDIRLPGENALFLTKKIKNIYPVAVVIILADHDLPEYREAAYQYGADYFVSKKSAKPDEIKGLVDSIASKKGF